MNRGLCLVILACLGAGPVFGRSYEITPRKISSKAEPGGRHVIGEIRYPFPAGSAWARLDRGRPKQRAAAGARES